MNLSIVLATLGLSQRDVARALGLSQSTVSRIVAGRWPAKGAAQARTAFHALLCKHGAQPAQLMGLPAIAAPKEVGPDVVEHVEADPPVTPVTTETQGEEPMLLPKQSISPQARDQFALAAVNPFDGDVTCDAEMFVNGEIRFVRETTWQTALAGGFLAIVGESGAGKTTMLDDLKDKVLRERRPLVFVEPSVEGMEDSEAKGKGIRSADIHAAIVLSLDAAASVAQSSEKRSRQVRRMLEDSTASGRSHLLVVEEAHALPVTTLNHLKRMWEKMKFGRKNMLGILLLGHPELEKKLDRYDVREVMQRCKVLRLHPLSSDLAAYLAVRCASAGRKVDEFITPDGIDELKTRLMSRTLGEQAPASLLYPLNVNNWMTAALNTAAELGAPVIDRDVVRAV